MNNNKREYFNCNVYYLMQTNGFDLEILHSVCEHFLFQPLKHIPNGFEKKNTLGGGLV